MTEKFIVKGGVSLKGEIVIRGAKNAIGKLLMASLLSDEVVKLTNVPLNSETDLAIDLITAIGARVERDDHSLTIYPNIKTNDISHLSSHNRIPILALGVLLGRSKMAIVPFSGASKQPESLKDLNQQTVKANGDKIGARPVDFHIASLEKMGAEVAISNGIITAKTDGLTGANIHLPYPSVGATENIIFASVLAKGRTTISNAAIEPEIIDLIKMLQKMGAIIELGADRHILIDGVEKLGGVEHHILPDRLEAASFAVMALATKGDIAVVGANQEHLITFLNTVRRLGGDYEVFSDGIRFFREGPLKPIHIETDTHPGFVTDWQQPLMVLLTQAVGTSVVHETVYEDRLGYTADLRKMGAKIEISTKCLGDLPCRYQGKMYPHSAIVNGPTTLTGTDLEMRDIRAGMAHLVASLIAEGESQITGIEHIDRGYEKIDERIKLLGANIKRVNI